MRGFLIAMMSSLVMNALGYSISSHITENQPKTKITVSKVIPMKPTNSPHMVLHTSKVCKFLMQLITARWRILCVNRIALSPFNCCRPTAVRPKELPPTPPDSAIVRARSRKLERMPNGSAHRHTASAPPPEGQNRRALTWRSTSILAEDPRVLTRCPQRWIKH